MFGDWQQLLPGMPLYICNECVAEGKGKAVSWEEIDNKVSAPWTDFQVASLREYQESDSYVPFTCHNNHRLLVRESGMRCRKCVFYQIWTYDWTLDWSWFE
ncbi:MAG TPA: hypothetical protein V6C81_28535 [Planktothrix sp.]|jgi:DNA-directed RNA polymerase subunit RPC12/RpoP